MSRISYRNGRFVTVLASPLQKFTMRWQPVMLALFVVFAPLTARASEFLVNTTTPNNQERPDVAAFADGGFVVVWEDDHNTPVSTLSFIRAQRFDAAGDPAGAELLVNSADASGAPVVAVLAGGGFVIAWTGFDDSSEGIKARRFAADGTALGAEFQVNTTIASGQAGASVAALADGGFIIAWHGFSLAGGDTNGAAVRAQRYDSAGNPAGSEFLVNTTTTGQQVNPSVAALAGGGFVIAWSDESETGADTSFEAIRAQRFDSAGLAQGDEVVINSTTQGSQTLPSVASLAGGGYVIAWQDYSETGGDTDRAAIRAQRFAADGTAQGSEFLVNTTTLDDQFEPAVTALAGGGFVISWSDFSGTGGDTSFDAIRAQRFTANGTAQDSEFLVNTTTSREQEMSAGTGLAGGDFVLVWGDRSPFASGDLTKGWDVRGDRFKPLSAGTTIFSSILPGARSGTLNAPRDKPSPSSPQALGDPITVFASVINAGDDSAQNCAISIPSGSPVSLSYQLTDAANAPVGLPDVPFAIAPGANKSFILAFTPTALSTGIDLFPAFVCDNASVAPIPGVNTVFLTIDDHAVPDILSIGATPMGDGIIHVPSDGISFMTASATNIGAGDSAGSANAAVTVTADDGGVGLPLLLQICETDALGACMSPPGTGPLATTIGSGASFFAVFVSDQASGGFPLDPANKRVFLSFKDAGGITRSIASAAVTVVAP